jgi:O-glycosyl hydrolase
MTTSTKKTEIADLLFTDLGIDIIRFKNWYYPDDYPTVKTTDIMTDDYSKGHWDATNELYTLAKARNANVKILLSSWGPPAALKSNNSTRETTGGATNNTLKKSGGLFMYDEFAQYWYDVLDHVPFDPDYISIQNEPTFSNTGWTTCTWSSAEGTLPSYITAFDKVYDKIKDRTFVPKMIGPESQDLFTYSPFVNLLKDKTHCSGFGYHPYNVNSGTSSTDIVSQLTSVGNLSTKPNIMTEFSDNLDWFNTAQFIQNTLLHANSAGYIYWKLVWAKPSSGTDAGMVSLANSGASTYTVTPYYHLIKHFAKHVDAGYHRVDVASTNANLVLTAFSNPADTKLTVIAVNKGAGQIPIDLKATGKTIKAISGNQSKSGSYYQALTIGGVTESITLPAQSITTFVLDVE